MDSIFYKSLRSDSCLYQTIKSYMDFFKDGGTGYQFRFMVTRVGSYIMTKLKISIEFFKLKAQSLF